MYFELAVDSKERCEFVDITIRIGQLVSDSGVQEGLLSILVPHTTAGLCLNENWDPDVSADVLTALDRLVPQDIGSAQQAGYRHVEGNSAAHIKASLMGASQVIPVHRGRLALGRWQGIYLVEFDGPRSRSVVVTLWAESPR